MFLGPQYISSYETESYTAMNSSDTKHTTIKASLQTDGLESFVELFDRRQPW